MAEEGMSTYVVQRLTIENGHKSQWQDIAIVDVPSRTKRKTIIEKAMEGHDVESDPILIRVLDDESSRTTPVTFEAQPARMVIG